MMKRGRFLSSTQLLMMSKKLKCWDMKAYVGDDGVEYDVDDAVVGDVAQLGVVGRELLLDLAQEVADRGVHLDLHKRATLVVNSVLEPSQ